MELTGNKYIDVYYIFEETVLERNPKLGLKYSTVDSSLGPQSSVGRQQLRFHSPQRAYSQMSISAVAKEPDGRT